MPGSGFVQRLPGDRGPYRGTVGLMHRERLIEPSEVDDHTATDATTRHSTSGAAGNECPTLCAGMTNQEDEILVVVRCGNRRRNDPIRAGALAVRRSCSVVRAKPAPEPCGGGDHWCRESIHSPPAKRRKYWRVRVLLGATNRITARVR